METSRGTVDLGYWVGRQQAFALVANQCSAAQALCLKQIKESRAYDTLGLNWEDFCLQHAGIDRCSADRIISRYNEFGEAYFRLSELTRVSPETYRRIAPQVTTEAIEIEGEKVPLTPENAPRIRAGIAALRSRARRVQEHYGHPVCDLKLRLIGLLEDSRNLVFWEMPNVTRDNLLNLCSEAIEHWTELKAYVQAGTL